MSKKATERTSGNDIESEVFQGKVKTKRRSLFFLQTWGENAGKSVEEE